MGAPAELLPILGSLGLVPHPKKRRSEDAMMTDDGAAQNSSLDSDRLAATQDSPGTGIPFDGDSDPWALWGFDARTVQTEHPKEQLKRIGPGHYRKLMAW